MKTEQATLEQVLDAVQSLREEVGRLNERVVALEAITAGPAAADQEAIGDELVLAISAAIAAFLGVKPHIRQIRLLSSASWAQHGRATIQASHHLAHH